MIPVKKKISLELNKAKTIWKDLIKHHDSDVNKISEVFNRYKMFLEENKELFRMGFGSHQEVKTVENILIHYKETTAGREKKLLLNNAYVGLVYGISESIEELSSIIEEDFY